MAFVVYGRFGTSCDMNNPTTFQYKAILPKSKRIGGVVPRWTFDLSGLQ